MNKTILLILLLIAINADTLNLETVRSQMLTRHNYYRAQHQVNDLTRVAAIESIAQNYSNYLVTLGYLVHSSNAYSGQYGENLYWGPKNSNIGIDSTDSWYNEVVDYDFNEPGFTSGTGHFTQLVWKGSQQLGCGVACGSNNYCFVTCNYYPPGNYLGQFPQNVFPFKEDSGESEKSDESEESDESKESDEDAK